MKGYMTQTGYMGLVVGRWILFATETEYHEYLIQDLYTNNDSEEARLNDKIRNFG